MLRRGNARGGLSGRLLVGKQSETDAQKQTVPLEMEPVVAVRLLFKLGLVNLPSDEKGEIEQLLGADITRRARRRSDLVTTLTNLEIHAQTAGDARGGAATAEDAEKALKKLEIEKPEVEKEVEPVRARQW